jgi:hypothetical protein
MMAPAHSAAPAFTATELKDRVTAVWARTSFMVRRHLLHWFGTHDYALTLCMSQILPLEISARSLTPSLRVQRDQRMVEFRK